MIIQDPNLQILNDKEVLVNILFQDIRTSFERTFFYFQPPSKKGCQNGCGHRNTKGLILFNIYSNPL